MNGSLAKNSFSVFPASATRHGPIFKPQSFYPWAVVIGILWKGNNINTYHKSILNSLQVVHCKSVDQLETSIKTCHLGISSPRGDRMDKNRNPWSQGVATSKWQEKGGKDHNKDMDVTAHHTVTRWDCRAKCGNKKKNPVDKGWKW